MPQRHAPKLLEVLESLDSRAFDASVWRHMFAENHPSRANDLGARWNPPGVPAIYCSLNRATARAEGDHLVSIQSLPPTADRSIYEIHVRLRRVLDISTDSALSDLGLTLEKISSNNFTVCQRIGDAAEWLEHDGIIVPSARHSGSNLVIFPRNQGADSVFEVKKREVIKRATR